jgi:hypothetical protein
MSFSRRQQVVTTVFCTVALLTVTATIYRAFTANNEVRMNEYRRRAEAAQPHRKSMVLADRAIMMKDEAVTINRTRLVFRGLQDGDIHLDLYLLDLDPQYPYLKKIPRRDARKGFRLGVGKYQMLTVNSRVLTLAYDQ